MYDQIQATLSQGGGSCVLIVPEQFTLEAEREAFEMMGHDVLMDLEVISFRNLAGKIENEVGGFPKRIEIVGRKMLLTKIMMNYRDQLLQFKGYESKPDFIDSLLNFIGDVKDNCVSPDQIDQAVEDLKTKDNKVLLSQRLAELNLLYRKYEEAIQGKNLDNSDLRSHVASKMAQSKWTKERNFWIYGFDSFSKRDMELINAIEDNARSLKVYMTYTDQAEFERVFASSKKAIDLLKTVKSGVCNMLEIGSEADEDFRPDRHLEKLPKAMATIEAQAFKLPLGDFDPIDDGHLKLMHAKDPEEEVHKVALEVLKLISFDDMSDEQATKEGKLRCRDISLIAGDIAEIAPIAKRVFDQYDIDLFVDEKRSIMHTQAATYLKNLLEYLSDGFKIENALKMAKTGMAGLDNQESEALQVYCKSYGISPKQMKETFYRGAEEIGEDKLAQLEEIRQKLVGSIFDEEDGLNSKIIEAKTGAAMARALRDFLVEDIKLNEKLKQVQERQEEEGFLEEASETPQTWEIIDQLLEETENIMANENLTKAEFSKMLIMGLMSKQIGLLPPSLDGLMIGSLQRSKRTMPAVTFIIGANQGLIPLTNISEGLIDMDDLSSLEKVGHRIVDSPIESISQQQLALYRAASRNKQGLYVSYRDLDKSGNKLEKSMFYENLEKMLGDGYKEEYDPREGDQGGISPLISGSNKATEKEVIRRLAACNGRAEDLPDAWKDVLVCFGEEAGKGQDYFHRGLDYSNDFGKLDLSTAKAIYGVGSDLRLSASRLQTFAKCPFQYFVKYGVRAEDRKEFKMKSFEFGSLLHDCLDHVVENITKLEPGKDGIENSLLMNIKDEDIDSQVDDFFKERKDDFCRGLFSSSLEMEFLLMRIAKEAKKLAKFIVEELVSDAGQDEKLSKVETEKTIRFDIKLESGASAKMEARIDRLDFLGDKGLRIIDYKSSRQDPKKEKVQTGELLQLAVYLIAAKHAYPDRDEMEAYFLNMTPAKPDYKGKKPDKPYKQEGHGRESSAEIEDIGRATIERLMLGIESGNIEVSPLHGDTQNSPCRYCEYRGICNYDRDIKASESRRE